MAVIAIWLVQYQRRVVHVPSKRTSSPVTIPYQTTVCGASGQEVVTVKRIVCRVEIEDDPLLRLRVRIQEGVDKETIHRYLGAA